MGCCPYVNAESAGCLGWWCLAALWWRELYARSVDDLRLSGLVVLVVVVVVPRMSLLSDELYAVLML